MTDLPDWWGRNPQKLPPKRKTPMKRLKTPMKRATMRRAPVPKNAVRTPGGTKATSPTLPTPPKAAKPPRGVSALTLLRAIKKVR